jgi:hypothetical protein
MKRAVLVVCDSEPESEYKKASADAFSKATSLLVGSTQDLLTRKPDNHLLHTWMNIIAHGKTVQTRDNPAKPCVYAAASKIVPVAVNFDNEFTKKHNKLVAAFRSIAKTKDSRWREATAGQKASVNIARAKDLRRLLVSLQRFLVIAGLECKYSSSKAQRHALVGVSEPFGRGPCSYAGQWLLAEAVAATHGSGEKGALEDWAHRSLQERQFNARPGAA